MEPDVRPGDAPEPGTPEGRPDPASERTRTDGERAEAGKVRPAPARRPQAKSAAALERDERVAGLWAAFGDDPSEELRNALVVEYQALLQQIVRRFAARLPRSVDRGDLVTAANVGLIRAIHGFDPERGVRFESYCELRVKGSLLDELRSQDWLPRPWRQKIEEQKRTYERLRREFGREPSDSEIAGAMGLGLDVYQQTFGVGLPGTPSGSMPSDEGGEDGPVSPLDVVADDAHEMPGDRLSRDELVNLVGQKLTDQERRIVYLKYWEELPMREIGELTGLSESRVCKIHTRLIERLQDRFRVHQEESV
ncbi:MAG: sigma-70 family RNA polymerase sigma factor [Planctomycetota bacterium]